MKTHYLRKANTKKKKMAKLRVKNEKRYITVTFAERLVKFGNY